METNNTNEQIVERVVMTVEQWRRIEQLIRMSHNYNVGFYICPKCGGIGRNEYTCSQCGHDSSHEERETWSPYAGVGISKFRIATQKNN